MRMQWLVVGLFVISLVGCNGGKNQTNIEPIDEMMDQINVKAQDWDPAKKDMRANMMPPENTIARGKKPYAYKGEPTIAEEKLVNPFKDDFSAPTLARGKERFDIYCAVCHGSTGHGDGPVAGKMIVKPKSLVTDLAKGYKDGRIFHIITDGQGLMGSYASQIFNEADRWKIVNYVRTLQRKSNTQ